MSEKSDLLINENKLGSRQEPSNKQRRTFIGGTLAALAASPLLAIPRRAMAEQMDTPSDPFILLLTGVYQPVPVGGGPNLGLSAVNLGDGSYSVTKIYPIFGIGNEGVISTRTTLSAIFTCSLPGSCVPTSFPEVRLRCASTAFRRVHLRVLTLSCLSPTGLGGSSWKEPSN
jgi:hypothetical protein